MGRIGLAIALIIIVIIIITVLVVVIYFATKKDQTADEIPVAGAPVDAPETTGTTTQPPPSNGIGPGTGCNDGSCMYGIMRATGATCRAIGGAMNGVPDDNAWADCHLDFGQAHMNGLHPWGECPEGTCHDVGVRMITSDCRALRGRVDGNPGESSETVCHFNMGSQPKYRFYGQGACPTGGTCRRARINARNPSQCSLIGGTPADSTTTGWTMCNLDLGSA